MRILSKDQVCVCGLRNPDLHLCPLALSRWGGTTDLSSHRNSLLASGCFPSFSKDLPRNSLMKYFPPISPCNENFSPELDAYCLPEKLIGLHFMWGIIIHRQTIFMFLVYKSLYFHCHFVYLSIYGDTQFLMCLLQICDDKPI